MLLPLAPDNTNARYRFRKFVQCRSGHREVQFIRVLDEVVGQLLMNLGQFHDTIDQILGYAAWRDTKTAIFLFNRNKNFTAVLEQIPDLLASHSHCIRMCDYTHETGWRAVYRHKDDPQRELLLTVHAYDVPS